MLLIQNDAGLTTGRTILQAFDRLEVVEFSARALIDTSMLGPHVPIGDGQLADLIEAFLS